MRTHLSQNLVSSATISSSNSTSANTSWLFDIGASHHQTSSHHVYNYGGSYKMLLGDGTSLSISHIGHTNINTSVRSLNFSDVLCVPNLCQKLIYVAKLCHMNQVFVEFFPLYFVVKDLCIGALLMWGEKQNDVYYATQLSPPQINTTIKLISLDLHYVFRHRSTRVFKSLVKDFGLHFSSMNFHCASCSVNKSHKLLFGSNSFNAT